jgi:hypothetical protein
MCNQENKENSGYENFDNANVAASPLMHYSGKEHPQHLVFNFCLNKNYYNNWSILNKFTYRSRTPKLFTVEFIVSNE